MRELRDKKLSLENTIYELVILSNEALLKKNLKAIKTIDNTTDTNDDIVKNPGVI